jgi:hypothetical protein
MQLIDAYKYLFKKIISIIRAEDIIQITPLINPISRFRK